jgi:hypothetical protein
VLDVRAPPFGLILKAGLDPAAATWGDAVSQTSPVIDELLASAHQVSGELVTRLLESDDAPTVRLGEAIRSVQSPPLKPPETGAYDGAGVGDPVTHDPAW